MKKIISMFAGLAVLASTSFAFAADTPSTATTANEEKNWNAGVLIGAGVPSFASVQGVFKYHDVVGLTVEYGFTPKFSASSDVDLRQSMFDIGARVYPFFGSFFLGCGVGQQVFALQDNSNSASMHLMTTFVSPRLGLLKRFSSGLSLGFDLGAEVPVGGDISFSNNIGSNQKVQNFGNSMKTTPIPFLHLLQLGYVY